MTMSADQPDLSQFIPEGWKGKLPPCQIQVNRNGELSSNGAPLIHPGILELIFASVHLEEDVYVLRVGEQSCQLEVEDTFFVVARVDEERDGLVLTLNDGSTEGLDPDSVYIGQQEVLYCRVKQGRFPARFLRPAYYQITRHIEQEDDKFNLVIGGHRHAVAHK
jgi:hypothetical protein